MNHDKDIEKLLVDTPLPEVVEGEHKVWLRAQLLANSKQDTNTVFAAPKRLILAASLLLGVVLAASYAYVVSTPKAFAETLEALRKVTSMKCNLSFELPGEKAREDTIYWVAPDKLRMDFGSEEHPIHETKWLEGDKLTALDYKRGSAVVMLHATADTASMQEGISKFATPGGLAELISQSGGVITKTEQDNHQAVVYHYADASSVECILDQETHLPLTITITRSAGKPAIMVQRLEWNVPIAAELMVPSIPNDIKASTIDYAAGGYPFDIRPGDGVGPVRLGMTEEEVIRALGEPDAKPFEDVHILAYYRHGIEVNIDTRRKTVFYIGLVLHEIMALPYKTFTGKTVEGIGIGSTEAEILQAFGPAQRRDVGEHGIVEINYRTRGIRFTLQPGWVKEWGNEARVTGISITKPR
jgi:outer membrane lipoprotein-sorting protein